MQKVRSGSRDAVRDFHADFGNSLKKYLCPGGGLCRRVPWGLRQADHGWVGGVTRGSQPWPSHGRVSMWAMTWRCWAGTRTGGSSGGPTRSSGGGGQLGSLTPLDS